MPKELAWIPMALVALVLIAALLIGRAIPS
jgi:hypothetical protein